MNKIITLVILSCSFTNLIAQPRKSESIEKRVDRAKEELSLSDDQAEQWTAIFEKHDPKIKETMDNRDREEGLKVRLNMEKELEAVLNEDQKEKFKEMRKKRKENRHPK